MSQEFQAGFPFQIIGMKTYCIKTLKSQKAIKKVTTEEQTETARKWLDKVNNSKFGMTKFIAISMFVPGFPADLLCYIYGLTNIRKRNMIIILMIAKPINLFIYAWIVTEPLKALLSI